MKKIIYLFLLQSFVMNGQWTNVVGYPLVNESYSSAIHGNDIYFASDNANTINKYDINSYTTVYPPSIYVGYDHVNGMAVKGDILYLSRYISDDILKIDLTLPYDNATVVVSGLNGPCGLAFKGDFLYICEYDGNKISKIDTTVPSPSTTDVLVGVTNPYKIEFLGDYLYYTHSQNSIDRYNVNLIITPPQPVVFGLPSSAIIRGLAFHGNELIFIEDGTNKISKVDVSQPFPLTINLISTFTHPLTLVTKDDYFFISDSWTCYKYDFPDVPLFTPISPICTLTTTSPLPTTSTNGITGTWSPAFTNATPPYTITTTTYTFTPNPGQNATTTTMGIQVYPLQDILFMPIDPICYGDTLIPPPNTSLNGITGTWSPALNNSVTITYTFTPDAGQCATTTTLTIVVTPSVTTTTAVTACDTYTWAVNGTTYTTSGTYTDINACSTNVLNLIIEVGTIWYADADGDGYGNPLVSVSACILPTGFVADNTDCDDTNPLVNPCAKEIRTDGIDNNCNGLIDEIGTKILNSQCGALLSGVNVNIFAQTITGVTVTGWRFKVTEMIGGIPSGYVQILPRSVNYFQLKDLPFYAYNKTYMVQVSVQVSGVWHPYDNPCCTVRTVSSAIMRPSLCGTTLATISDNIIAENVNFIKPASFNPWRFRVTDPSLASEVFDYHSRVIKLSYLVTPGFVKYNTTYTVEVAFLNVDGSWSDYSLPCTITTPPFPTTQIQTSQCGFTATSGTQNIYATGIPPAVGVPSMYRFRISLGSTFIDSEDNLSRSFYLNEFTGLLLSTTYNVDVSVEIGGVFGPYGSVCTITTPGVFRTIDEDVMTAIEFNAIAYPNPFENNFNINVTSNLESLVRIRVYDMLGKLIEDTNVESTEISNYEIGNNYRSGVYNVIVSQGEYYANTRVIKR